MEEGSGKIKQEVRRHRLDTTWGDRQNQAQDSTQKEED